MVGRAISCDCVGSAISNYIDATNQANVFIENVAILGACATAGLFMLWLVVKFIKAIKKPDLCHKIKIEEGDLVD